MRMDIAIDKRRDALVWRGQGELPAPPFRLWTLLVLVCPWNRQDWGAFAGRPVLTVVVSLTLSDSEIPQADAAVSSSRTKNIPVRCRVPGKTFDSALVAAEYVQRPVVRADRRRESADSDALVSRRCGKESIGWRPFHVEDAVGVGLECQSRWFWCMLRVSDVVLIGRDMGTHTGIPISSLRRVHDVHGTLFGSHRQVRSPATFRRCKPGRR